MIINDSVIHGESKQINRNYKDGIFRKLFNNEKNLRELYNDLTGSSYGEETPINIKTLEDVIYVDIKDDIAFTIGDQFVVLLEAQSTLCKNMPVRMLSYIGRLYEKMYDRNTFYRSSLVALPTPEFFVFYNGDEDSEEEFILKLSNSFSKKFPDCNLELIVKVYNIKYNESVEILKKNEILRGYSIMIAKTKEGLSQGLTPEEAINNAVRYCRGNNILVDFLKIHGSEAIGMLFDYISKEEYAELKGAEQYDIGFEKGIEKGIEKGSEQERLTIARALKSEGLDSAIISKTTGLTIEEIESL